MTIQTSPPFEELKNRLAHSDHDLWLGRLVWYSVSATEMAHQDLGRLMAQTTLRGFIPRPPADIDVFRRICTKAQRKKVATHDPAVYLNYMVRDVGSDTDGLYKVLVKETVDTAGKKLDHDSQICRINFVRASSGLDVSCTGGDATADDIADEIRTSYYTKKGWLDSYAIRELVRRIINSCNATNVRGAGGGVFFVAEKHGATIDALEEMSHQLPGVMVHSLPLLDDTKQREMLQRAFESETAEAADSMMAEMGKLIALGTRVTPDKAQSFLGALTDLRKKHNEMADLLETTMEVSQSRLDLMQRQVMRLANLVEA